jgi:branched-chain amino acid transport system permease protein
MAFGQLLSQGLTFGAVFAVVALAYHLIYVTTGFLNFALGEQMAIGGLVVLTLLGMGLPLPVAIALAVLAGAVVGGLYERLAMTPAKPMGPAGPILASIGVALVLTHGRVLLWGPNPRSLLPFTGGENATVHLLGGRWFIQSFWIIGLAAASTGALLWFLRHTPWGRRWRATAQDPLGARLCGVNPQMVSTGSVALAGALVTLMGIAIAPISLAGGFFGLEFGVKGFAAAIIGGFDSTSGVMLGGLIVGLLDSFLAGSVSGAAADATLYALLIVALLIRPHGLLGTPAVDRA